MNVHEWEEKLTAALDYKALEVRPYVWKALFQELRDGNLRLEVECAALRKQSEFLMNRIDALEKAKKR